MNCLTFSKLVLASGFAAVLRLNAPAQGGIADSAETAKPITKGTTVPDVTLQAVEGKGFALRLQATAQWG